MSVLGRRTVLREIAATVSASKSRLDPSREAPAVIGIASPSLKPANV